MLTLSIIIPAYNVEAFIGETLDSVMCQTVQPDEIIVINDGSTDNTQTVIDRYADKRNVRTLSTCNNGLGFARNVGLFTARSQLVYFLDADDIIVDDFVAVVKKAFRADTDMDIFMFSGQALSGDAETARYDNLFYRRGFSKAGMGAFETLERLHYHHSLISSACLYVTKRRLWVGNNLSFGNHVQEDQGVLIPLIAHARRLSVIDDPLFLRRRRNDSIMSNPRTAAHWRGACQNLISYLALYQYSDIDKRIRRRFVRRHALMFCRMLVLIRLKTNIRNPGVSVLKVAWALRAPQALAYEVYYHWRRILAAVRG